MNKIFQVNYVTVRNIEKTLLCLNELSENTKTKGRFYEKSAMLGSKTHLKVRLEGFDFTFVIYM